MRYTDFEIEERLLGDTIQVTVYISHDGKRNLGESGTKPPPPPPGWALFQGPVVYVTEPNIIERAIGITLEGKLNRARAKISAWVTRQHRLQDVLDKRIEVEAS